MAIPDLHLIAIGCRSARQVHASAVVRPGKMIIARVVPLLIGASSIASIQLEFIAIDIATVCDIQAHDSIIRSNSAVTERKLLVYTAVAIRNDYRRAIRVTIKARQALGIIKNRLDLKSTLVEGSLCECTLTKQKGRDSENQWQSHGMYEIMGEERAQG